MKYEYDRERAIALFLMGLTILYLGFSFESQKVNIGNEKTLITVEKNYEIGEYRFELKERIGSVNDKPVVGQTGTTSKGFCLNEECLKIPFTGNGSKEVEIKTDRYLGDIYQTCVHEVTHNKYPWMSHPHYNWFINRQENTYEEICVELVAEMKVDQEQKFQ